MLEYTFLFFLFFSFFFPKSGFLFSSFLFFSPLFFFFLAILYAVFVGNEIHRVHSVLAYILRAKRETEGGWGKSVFVDYQSIWSRSTGCWIQRPAEQHTPSHTQTRSGRHDIRGEFGDGQQLHIWGAGWLAGCRRRRVGRVAPSASAHTLVTRSPGWGQPVASGSTHIMLVG